MEHYFIVWNKAPDISKIIKQIWLVRDLLKNIFVLSIIFQVILFSFL
jgi:hypothetical protein